VTRVSHVTTIKQLEGRIAKLESLPANKNPKGGKAVEVSSWSGLPILHGRKRSFKTPSHSSFTKYGLTSSTIKTNGTDALSSGLVCSGWPSWAFTVMSRGRLIDVLILNESPWTQHLVP
jgi:hypothetical protein